MSRRAYARSRKIDESTVRKHLKAGTLADAVLPDGSIDPEKADAILRASRTRGKVVPVSLQVAKARRERALALKDWDTLAALERMVVNPAEAYLTWVPEHLSKMVAVFGTLPDRALPRIAGQTATEINTTLKSLVNDLLTEASSVARQQGETLERDHGAVTEPDLEAMTPVALDAFRAETQAKRLELQRHLARGRLRYSDTVLREMAEAISVAKSLLLAIPARNDVALAAASPDEARVLLAEGVDLAIAALNAPVERFRQSVAA